MTDNTKNKKTYILNICQTQNELQTTVCVSQIDTQIDNLQTDDPQIDTRIVIQTDNTQIDLQIDNTQSDNTQIDNTQSDNTQIDIQIDPRIDQHIDNLQIDSQTDPQIDQHIDNLQIDSQTNPQIDQHIDNSQIDNTQIDSQTDPQIEIKHVVKIDVIPPETTINRLKFKQQYKKTETQIFSKQSNTKIELKTEPGFKTVKKMIEDIENKIKSYKR